MGEVVDAAAAVGVRNNVHPLQRPVWCFWGRVTSLLSRCPLPKAAAPRVAAAMRKGAMRLRAKMNQQTRAASPRS